MEPAVEFSDVFYRRSVLGDRNQSDQTILQPNRTSLRFSTCAGPLPGPVATPAPPLMHHGGLTCCRGERREEHPVTAPSVLIHLDAMVISSSLAAVKPGIKALLLTCPGPLQEAALLCQSGLLVRHPAPSKTPVWEQKDTGLLPLYHVRHRKRAEPSGRSSSGSSTVSWR